METSQSLFPSQEAQRLKALTVLVRIFNEDAQFLNT